MKHDQGSNGKNGKGRHAGGCPDGPVEDGQVAILRHQQGVVAQGRGHNNQPAQAPGEWFEQGVQGGPLPVIEGPKQMVQSQRSQHGQAKIEQKDEAGRGTQLVEAGQGGVEPAVQYAVAAQRQQQGDESQPHKEKFFLPPGEDAPNQRQ